MGWRDKNQPEQGHSTTQGHEREACNASMRRDLRISGWHLEGWVGLSAALNSSADIIERQVHLFQQLVVGSGWAGRTGKGRAVKPALKPVPGIPPGYFMISTGRYEISLWLVLKFCMVSCTACTGMRTQNQHGKSTWILGRWPFLQLQSLSGTPMLNSPVHVENAWMGCGTMSK